MYIEFHDLKQLIFKRIESTKVDFDAVSYWVVAMSVCKDMQKKFWLPDHIRNNIKDFILQVSYSLSMMLEKIFPKFELLIFKSLPFCWIYAVKLSFCFLFDIFICLLNSLFFYAGPCVWFPVQKRVMEIEGRKKIMQEYWLL